ncbi:TIGR04255 family protein [Legionella qingyii]|uniref:TIGR04255 family protein n=1 Tax=Legionella qingyii TaxID=2184757 RepID=A0A317U1E5_9GAMM|nr:TIGR04255 family protein [Legionella qingyii]PWY54322.1 TIGR04255 family protein [Legionella qingyii]RUR24134.1 TIGR04255 family protein [Legionella qingyii]
MKKRKYNKPQLQEAIFEAKFDFENFDTAMPGQIFEFIKNDYPLKQDIKHFSLPYLLENPANAQPPFIQAPLIRASKNDGSGILQFGPGIAIANNLKYEGWDSFVPTINKILSAYIDVAKPIYVSRIGTRYINNIHIAEENLNVSDYFNLDIQIPNHLKNFKALELTFLNEVSNINNIKFIVQTRFLTDSLRPGEVGGRFILDLDCYISNQFESEIIQIISLAKESHDILEEFFESIITNKTRSLLEVINE